MTNTDWNQIRSLFPVCNHWAYFNNAYVAPTSSIAAEIMRDCIEQVSLHGETCLEQWFAPIDRCRKIAADMINASPTEIAILKNTSECLATVAEGIDWKTGENIVIVEKDYPANVYPWMHAQDHGVEVRMVPWHNHRIRREDLAARVDRQTRVVALSHVQFTNGFRHDLEQVHALCREHDALLSVDAIQSFGVLPIDVERMGIDFLAAGSHKWLAASLGTALLYIRQSLLTQLRPIEVGWKSTVNALDFSTIDFRLRTNAGRFECGSLPLANIAALAVNLELLCDIGQQETSLRIRMLTDRLIDGIKELGGDVYSVRNDAHWSGIVAFGFADSDPDVIVEHCRQEGVVICNRDGMLRASPHIYNNEEDVDRLVAALRWHA